MTDLENNVLAAHVILKHALLEDLFVKVKQCMRANHYRFVRLEASEKEAYKINTYFINADDIDTTPDDFGCEEEGSGLSIESLFRSAGIDSSFVCSAANYIDEDFPVDVTPDTTIQAFKAQFMSSPEFNGNTYDSNFVLGDVQIPERSKAFEMSSNLGTSGF